MWGIKLLWLWRLLSSGMPHSVVWIDADVSEENGVFIFMVEEQTSWDREGVDITMSGL